MELGLDDKVALVTGASQGIGKAIADALAHEGCRVVICARGEDDLRRAAEQIREESGGVVLAVQADVTNQEDADRMVAQTIDQFGTVHILVNNVGTIGSGGPFEELSDEEWLRLYDTNVVSAVRMTRAVVPHMKEQEWGRIINVSSENGEQPYPDMMPYSATKAALLNVTKSLSKAYGEHGILVNALAPAFIQTPLVEGMLQERAEQQGISVDDAEEQFLQENRPHIELQRAGQPDEVAAAAVFLASEAASFVTGANYRVDGGSVASLP